MACLGAWLGRSKSGKHSSKSALLAQKCETFVKNRYGGTKSADCFSKSDYLEGFGALEGLGPLGQPEGKCSSKTKIEDQDKSRSIFKFSRSFRVDNDRADNHRADNGRADNDRFVPLCSTAQGVGGFENNERTSKHIKRNRGK